MILNRPPIRQAAPRAPDQIGRISVPLPAKSGATFPLVSDFGYGMSQDWKVVEHRFGELATLGVQRYGVGSGARRFSFGKSVLCWEDRQALLDFYDETQGGFQSFTYPAPNTDRQTFTNVEVVFDQPPLSVNDLQNRASTGLTFNEIIDTASAPTIDITDVCSRFPSTALAQALASEVQIIIPLLHIKVRNPAVPDIWLSDRRVNIGNFPGAPSSPCTFLPRLLSVGVPGTGDVIMSQSIDGRAENVRFNLGNADRALSALVNDCSIDYAAIDLSFLHVGTGILLQLWKGILISWQIDPSSVMAVQCSDGLYPITQAYPPRVVSRQCWKPFDQDVMPGFRPCPYSTVGSGGDPTSCDYFFNSANGCLSHGMSNYFGGHPEQPQSVFIKDNGTGIIGGFLRSMVTSTSILSDSIWGAPLPEIWCNDMGTPQRAFIANCLVAAVRNESDFYDLLGIVGAGPLGAYEGMSVQTNSAGYKFVVAPTGDGFVPQGFKIDGNLNITGYQPQLGLRQSVGHDPALKGANRYAGQDAFSLGQGTPQDWSESVGGGFTNIGVANLAIPYAAGTALQELRYAASAGTGLTPTTAESHSMTTPIRLGLTGSVWDAEGNWSAFPGCINPFWVAANTYLRALGIQQADAATQLSYLVLDSFVTSDGMGAADIADQWVNPIVGTVIPAFGVTAKGAALQFYNLDYFNATFAYQNSSGATVSMSLSAAQSAGYIVLMSQPNVEPQFMFQGTLTQFKPFRDWINEILNCALGFWCFEFGKLKVGCRYNAIPTDSFTIGSMIYQSLAITPLPGAFEYLKINFANVELQYQQDLAEYEDKDHALYFGRGQNPLTSSMNSVGISTLSQGLRIAVTRTREEVGGILRTDLANPYAEYDNNKRVSFKSTLLALNNEVGQVISVTHPDVPTYPGAASGSKAGSNGPFPANTWPFRIKKWMLHSDWSISILGDSCVDSMYDLDVGPVPSGVGPRPLPVMYWPEPLGQWAPHQIQADPADALYPGEFSFNLEQTFQYQGDGTLLTSALLAGCLPVNQFIPNCGAPDIKKGNVSWASTGGSIPGGTTLFVQICAAIWDTTQEPPVVQQLSPPSEIVVFQVHPGTDTNTITLNNIVWPSTTGLNGWILFCNEIEDLICGQMSGLGSGGSTSRAIDFDFTTGTLPGGITFSRPSIGTYFNNIGILTTAAANAARFNHVGGIACLLIEPTATNLLPQSNAFATSPWTDFDSANATPGQFVSPDGTNNGWSIVTGAGQGSIYQAGFAFSNMPYTISIWAKLITGIVGLTVQLNGVNGFVQPTTTLTRLSGTNTIPSGSGLVLIGMNSSAPPTDKNGIYGAQLETGSVPTSYIPTTTAAVTRAADSATFTIPAGVSQLTYTFDDGSTQVVSVAAGTYTIPTNLNRPNIKSIQSPAGSGGTGLPSSITFNGPIQRSTYAVPDYDVAILRLRAQVLIHGGVIGAGVDSMTSSPPTITSSATVDAAHTDNWTNRVLAIIGRQGSDGIAPWAHFKITSFAPATGVFGLDRDPIAAGVLPHDVFTVCFLGSDNSSNPYVIGDPGLANAQSGHVGESINDPNRIGRMVRVIAGKSRGMQAKIVSNLATSYTLDRALPIDATSIWIVTDPGWNYSKDVIINNADPTKVTLSAIEINNYNGLPLLVEGVTIDAQGTIIDDTNAPARMLFIPGVQGTTNVKA